MVYKKNKPPKKIPNSHSLVWATLHAWGFGIGHHISVLTGLSPSGVSQALKALKKAGWVHELGYAQEQPMSPHYGLYYAPAIRRTKLVSTVKYTRKHKLKAGASGGVICQRKTELQKVEVRNFDGFMVKMPAGYKEKGVSTRLPTHNVWVLHAAEYIGQLMNKITFGIGWEIESEFLLRRSRGWYGKGQQPTGEKSVLCSVPDFVVKCSGVEVHVEVELTLKSKEDYKQILRGVLPSKKPILYLVRNEETRTQLIGLLPSRAKTLVAVLYSTNHESAIKKLFY